MIQVEEYLLATFLWAGAWVCVGAALLKKSTRLRHRLASIALSIVAFVICSQWTVLKKGDKPWSAFTASAPRPSKVPRPTGSSTTQRMNAAVSSPSPVVKRSDAAHIETPSQGKHTKMTEATLHSRAKMGEPHREINQVPQTLNVQPILSARLINPAAPEIIVENTSDAVAENIHWQLVMFRLQDHAFCSYGTQNIGYVKGHSRSGNYSMDLNSIPHAPQTPRLATGDRLVGSISVDCPTCKGTTLIVSFVWGTEGWFYALPDSTGGVYLPKKTSDEYIDIYAKSIETIPSSSRQPISVLP